MFDDDKAPIDGVPQGFSDDIEKASLPEFGDKDNKPIDNKTYMIIGGAAGAILLLIVVTLILILGVGKEKEKYTAEDMVNTYIKIVSGEQVAEFDKFIYKNSSNSKDVEKFLESSKNAFKDKKIFTKMSDFKEEKASKDSSKYIKKILGKKVKNPKAISFNVYYSESDSSEPELYTVFSFYTGEIGESTYFAYGSSGSTIKLKAEETPTDAEEEEVVETATEQDAEKKLSSERIAVGSPDVGTVEVPSDFILSDFDTSVLSKVDSKYSYKSPDGTMYVVLIKFSNSAKNLSNRAAKVTSAFVPDCTVVTGEEVDRIEECYFGYGESGNSRVETYTVAAKEDGFTRCLAIIAPKGSEIFDIWSTYSLEQGFGTLPGASPIPNVPEGMKVVGNDDLGYLLVAEDFGENADYNYDNSKGWTKGKETIALISYKGTPQGTLPTSEFAESMKTLHLGGVGEEWDSGDWFPGALYSRNIEEDKVTEIFCFKGQDGINRLLLVISPDMDAKVQGYYESYVLPMGVIKDID